MSEPFARSGEAVTDESGKIICFVKRDLFRHQHVKAEDFHMFAVGEEPWKPTDRLDSRCTRIIDGGRLQLCINGKWRPA